MVPLDRNHACPFKERQMPAWRPYAANELGVTVSCDLNYRKNLWKYGKTAAEVMRNW